MEEKERVTKFLQKWKQSDTRNAGSQEESLLYPTPEPTEKKNEKQPRVTQEEEAELRQLTMEEEEDEWFVWFITGKIIIPKPSGKQQIDYDYMQMSRLLSKQTQIDLNNQYIQTSRYLNLIKRIITGPTQDIL